VLRVGALLLIVLLGSAAPGSAPRYDDPVGEGAAAVTVRAHAAGQKAPQARPYLSPLPHTWAATLPQHGRLLTPGAVGARVRARIAWWPTPRCAQGPPAASVSASPSLNA
jgi:hypothetical protein